jgi:hypothetical protein
MTEDTKAQKTLTSDVMQTSGKIKIDEIVGSSAHDKIMLAKSESLSDCDKIKALRAAAEIGKSALSRGDFKEFKDSVELAAKLIDDF